MSCVRKFAVVLAVSTVAPLAMSAPPAPGVYTVDPPAEVKALLTRLKERDEHVSAIRLLGARNDSAPYIRLELKTATKESHKRDLTEALARIEGQVYERNAKRYSAWVEGGRLDLCAELLVTCPNKDDASKLADLTLPLRKRIFAGFRDTFDPYPPGYKGTKNVFWEWELKRQHNPTHEAGGELTLPPTTGWGGAVFVRADRCLTQTFGKDFWFVAVRSDLREEAESVGMKSDGHWYNVVLLVNNSTKLSRVADSLIVCDGDIDLVPGVEKSVIIANGDIRSKDGNGGDRTYLCATGDIVLPRRKQMEKSAFHAGGTVTFAEKPEPSYRVREKQPALPFGVRFLDPEEFGVVLGAQNGGVQVMKIAPDSPFAKYDVRDSDVILSIDDAKATSLPVFRRQLRRGLLSESVFLRIRRGNVETTRIVFLDGIPLEKAPMPRAK